MITITDPAGSVLAWSSAGLKGFKGPKKATPYAATQVAEDVLFKVRPFNVRTVDVYVTGIGYGRESAIRTLHGGGIAVESIRDITPIPHNGPRPSGPRRV
jgi:small subunit ribosomal protein S11